MLVIVLQQQVIYIANDGTTAGVVPTSAMAPTGLMAVASASMTQNTYTADRIGHDEMLNHHHQAEASAPDYSLYNRKHKDLD